MDITKIKELLNVENDEQIITSLEQLNTKIVTLTETINQNQTLLMEKENETI
jgi:hypothetical protein